MLTPDNLRVEIARRLESLVPVKVKHSVSKQSKSIIEPESIVELVEKSMLQLRDLIDKEAKKMMVEFSKDVCFSLDSVLRTFIEFLRQPDIDLDVDKLKNNYSSLQNSFQEKYKSFFSNEYENPTEIFFSLDQTFEELTSESKKLAENLDLVLKKTTPPLVEETMPKQSEEKSAISKPASLENKKDEGQKGGGLFGRITSIFKKDDGFIKTNLGNDSSGMRWDPIKKKWLFDDDEGEVEEEKPKLPPTKEEIAKKKEEEEKKDDEPESKKNEPDNFVNALIKPRARNLGKAKTAAKAKGQGPKAPKVTAQMFDDINAVANEFTVEQQRELIIFEMKEQLRSLLQEAASNLNMEEELTDHQESKSLIVEGCAAILEENLACVFEEQLEQRKRERELRQRRIKNEIPKLSRGCQTDPFIDPQLKSRDKEVTTLKERERINNIMDVHEDMMVVGQQKMLQEFNVQLVRTAAKDLEEYHEALQLAQKYQERLFTNSEVKKIVETVSSMSQIITRLKQDKQSSSNYIKILKSTIDLLVKENDRKGNYIVLMQKKFKERQSKLYTLMKQADVLKQEKSLLKAISKVFLQESCHYQEECDKLSLELEEVNRLRENEAAYSNQYILALKGFLDKVKENLSERNERDIEVELDSLEQSVAQEKSRYLAVMTELWSCIELAKERFNIITEALKSAETTKTEAISDSNLKVESLRDELRKANERIEDYENKYDNFQAEMETTEANIKSKEEEITLLKQDLAQLRDKLGVMEEKEIESEQTRNTYEVQWSKVWEWINDQQAEYRAEAGEEEGNIIQALEKISSRIKEITSGEISEIQNEANELREKVKILSETNAGLEGELESKKVQISTLQDDTTGKNQLIELNIQIENQLDEKNEEIKRLDQLLKQESTKIIDQLDKIESLENQLDQANTKIAEEDKQVSELKTKLEQTEEKLKDLSKQIEVLTSQSEIDRELIKKLEASGSQDETSNAIVFSLKDAILNHEKTVEELKADINSSKEASESLHKEIELKNQSIAEVTTLNTFFKEQIAALDEKIKGLEASEKSLQDSITQLKEENKVLRRPSLSEERGEGSNQSNEISEIVKGTPAQIEQYMEEQNRRISLLLLDLQDSQNTIREREEDRLMLKDKYIQDLKQLAESNRPVKEFLNHLFPPQEAKSESQGAK